MNDIKEILDKYLDKPDTVLEYDCDNMAYLCMEDYPLLIEELSEHMIEYSNLCLDNYISAVNRSIEGK